jgi:hypothetical protein
MYKIEKIIRNQGFLIGEKEKIDLTDGFFDCEKRLFIRPKIIETPAILSDVDLIIFQSLYLY